VKFDDVFGVRLVNFRRFGYFENLEVDLMCINEYDDIWKSFTKEELELKLERNCKIFLRF
jgi:hypothetical protein